MKKLFFASLFFAMLLLGCVQQQALEDTGLAELNASVRVLQAKCDALGAEKQALQSSLSQANAAKQECESSLAAAKAKQATPNKLNEIEKALAKPSLLEAEKTAREKYREYDYLACGYYIGATGFYTSGNVTVPLGCVLAISAYISASKAYLDEANASKAEVENALRIVRELKG